MNLGRSSQKLSPNELIWGKDVARIFGISRAEFHRRLKDGRIKGIRAVRMLQGNKFSIYDAFEVAHPRADKKTIEELILKFRMSKTEKRRG